MERTFLKPSKSDGSMYRPDGYAKPSMMYPCLRHTLESGSNPAIKRISPDCGNMRYTQRLREQKFWNSMNTMNQSISVRNVMDRAQGRSEGLDACSPYFSNLRLPYQMSRYQVNPEHFNVESKSVHNTNAGVPIHHTPYQEYFQYNVHPSVFRNKTQSFVHLSKNQEMARPSEAKRKLFMSNDSISKGIHSCHSQKYDLNYPNLQTDKMLGKPHKGTQLSSCWTEEAVSGKAGLQHSLDAQYLHMVNIESSMKPNNRGEKPKPHVQEKWLLDSKDTAPDKMHSTLTGAFQTEDDSWSDVETSLSVSDKFSSVEEKCFLGERNSLEQLESSLDEYPTVDGFKDDSPTALIIDEFHNDAFQALGNMSSSMDVQEYDLDNIGAEESKFSNGKDGQQELDSDLCLQKDTEIQNSNVNYIYIMLSDNEEFVESNYKHGYEAYLIQKQNAERQRDTKNSPSTTIFRSDEISKEYTAADSVNPVQQVESSYNDKGMKRKKKTPLNLKETCMPYTSNVSLQSYEETSCDIDDACVGSALRYSNRLACKERLNYAVMEDSDEMDIKSGKGEFGSCSFQENNAELSKTVQGKESENVEKVQRLGKYYQGRGTKFSSISQSPWKLFMPTPTQYMHAKETQKISVVRNQTDISEMDGKIDDPDGASLKFGSLFRRSRRKALLRFHGHSRRNFRKYPCKHCGMRYSKPYLFMHEKQHCIRVFQNKATGERAKTYPCKYCGRRYCKPYLYNHQKYHMWKLENGRTDRFLTHSVKTKISQVRKTRRAIKIKLERNTATGCLETRPMSSTSHDGRNKKYQCKECKYQTDWSERWLSHKLVHQQSKHVTCDQCSIAFSSMKALKIWHTKNGIMHIPEAPDHSVISNIYKDTKQGNNGNEENDGILVSDLSNIDNKFVKEREQGGPEDVSDESKVEVLQTGSSSASQKVGIVHRGECEGKPEAKQCVSCLASDRQCSFVTQDQHVICYSSKDSETVSSNLAELDCGDGFDGSMGDTDSKEIDEIVDSSGPQCSKENCKSTSSDVVDGSEGIDEGAESNKTGNSENNDDKSNCNSNRRDEGTSDKRIERNNSDDGNGDDEDDIGSDDGNNNEVNTIPLRCIICESIFSEKLILLRHLTRIHRLLNLCQICYFKYEDVRRFSNPVSLRNHKLREHPEDMVKCVCGTMLIDQAMLASHLNKFKCNARQDSHSASDMVKCTCGKRFGSPQLLLNHKSRCRKRKTIEDIAETLRRGQSKSQVALLRKSPKLNTDENYQEVKVKYDDYLQQQSTSSCDMMTSSCGSMYKMESKESPSIDCTQPSADDTRSSHTAEATITGMGDMNNNNMANNMETEMQKKSKIKGTAETRKGKAPAKKKRKKKKPDAEGRYPCKTCGRKFKRPYLYVHQKQVHQRKQWIYVPQRPKIVKRYQCGYCKYKSVSWGTVLTHHYGNHQEFELNILDLPTTGQL